MIRMLTASLMIFANPVAAEYIPGTDIKVENWSGAAYTFDTTGAFSHCVVSAPYVSGDTLFLSVNRDATVSVGVVSPNLKMQPGQEFPVSLYIDRRAPFYGQAVAQSSDFAILVLPDFDSALTALQKGRLLVLDTPLGRGEYDLTGTHRALNETLNCVVRNGNYASNSSPSTQPIEPRAPDAAKDKTLLFQVATGMIADMGMTDFVYLSQAETTALFSSDAVAWKSPSMGIFGGVIAVSANGLAELKTTDAEDFSFLSKQCDGEIATTSRPVSMVDFQSRELRSMCVEDSNSTESLLNKTLVGDSVLYTLLVFDQKSSVSESNRRREMSEQAAIRAVSFVK